MQCLIFRYISYSGLTSLKGMYIIYSKNEGEIKNM